MEETKGELWDDRERLIKDITADIKRHTNGEAGGNLIYKYRARGLLECFGDIHALAFDHLKEYLTQKDQYDRALFETVKALSWHSKRDLLNLKLDTELNLDFDVIEMISNPSLRQEQEQAAQSYKPTKVRITRTPQQIESIERQLTFYGSDVGGMTMLMSRFPIRRLYRKATRIQ